MAEIKGGSIKRGQLNCRRQNRAIKIPLNSVLSWRDLWDDIYLESRGKTNLAYAKNVRRDQRKTKNTARELGLKCLKNILLQPEEVIPHQKARAVKNIMKIGRKGDSYKGHRVQKSNLLY